MPLTGLMVRPAREGDGAGVSAIVDAVSAVPETLAFIQGRFGSVEKLADGCGRADRTLTAELGGRVVGFASWRQDEGVGVVEFLAVRPEFQGWGVGKALLSALMERAKLRGIRLIDATAPGRLRKAVGLFEAVGFREIGRSVRLVRKASGRTATALVPAENVEGLMRHREREFRETDVWVHYEKRFARMR